MVFARQAGELVKGFTSVGCLAHYLQVGFAVEEGAQAASHDLMIVYQEDADGFLAVSSH